MVLAIPGRAQCRELVCSRGSGEDNGAVVALNEWNIQSRAHACQACNKSFADKETYHTLLFDEHSHFVRLDICGHCWRTQYQQHEGVRNGFVSYWHGVYEAPPVAPPEPIKKEAAETLLRRVIELRDPAFSAAAFILAVMLERKRILKVKEQIVREGRRTIIYEHPKSGDLYTIIDPHLQLNQLTAVQHQVMDLLEHGLPEKYPPAPDASAAVEPAQAGPEAAPAEPGPEPEANPAPPEAAS